MTGRLDSWLGRAVLLSGLFASDVGRAAVIAVDGTTCSLGNAILSANTDSAIGGCTAGAGADTIVLDADVYLTTPMTPSVEGGPSGLPAITSKISISAGASARIERGIPSSCEVSQASAMRLLEVSAGGDLDLVGLNLRYGCVASASAAETASGGALLVRAGGVAHLEGCRFEFNGATGAPAAADPTPALPGAARGGAVAVLGGRLTVTSTTFYENRAMGNDARGGALAVEGGELELVIQSRFHLNRSAPIPYTGQSTPTSGGGLALREATVGTLAYVEFDSNATGPDSPGLGGPASGGGLAITGGSVGEIRDSSFVGNVARAGSFSILQGESAHGGGLASDGRIDTVARTSFYGNQALGFGLGEGRGGGLDNSGSIGRVLAASFLFNTAQGGFGVHGAMGPSLGGGLANVGSIGQLATSSLVGNDCPDLSFISSSAGGGIYNAVDGTAPDGGISLANTLLSGNSATIGADCQSTSAFVSLGFNLAQAPDASCLFASAGDVIGTSAFTMNPGDNGCTVELPSGSCLPTVSLSLGGPALDSGLCASAGSEVDARGFVRPHDLPAVANAPGSDGCDIGAAEYLAAPAAVHLGLSVADSADPVASGQAAGNLTYTVSLASLGMQAATAVAVAVTLPLPTGVTLDVVTPSAGSWDGATWTLSSLPSGGQATLTFVLTVGFGTAGGADVLSLSAAVTAATGHSGELASDIETTSVIEGIFFDGFASGDTSAWSLTVGGD